MRMKKWCILSTSSGRTLPLAKSLDDAGIEAWTPKKTVKLPKPGRYNGPRRMVEVDAPILPMIVFARAIHVLDLFAITKAPASRHPSFSVVHHGPRLPLVAEDEIAGLRSAESEAADMIGRIREAESEEEKRQLRIAALRTEQARRKAMRAQRRQFERGQPVHVVEAPALVGLTGIIERSDSKSALVGFGGALFMQIETWQLLPIYIQGDQP